MAEVGYLLDFLSRFAHSDANFHRVVQDGACQFADVLRHGGAEHDGLSVSTQIRSNLDDIIVESHVEHTVGFVQDEEGCLCQVDMSTLQMADKSARSGNDDVGTRLQSTSFLFKADAVVATIYSHTTHAVQIVAEALYLLVNLLRQLAGWSHDDAVDGILGIKSRTQLVEHRQEVCRRFSCAGLSHTDDVAACQNGRNGFFLNRRTFFEVHGIQCVKHFVRKV